MDINLEKLFVEKSKNKITSYTLIQLKEIAGNLDISKSGVKKDIVNRILVKLGKIEKDNTDVTVTITFSECVENNPTMQKIGVESLHGFSINDLLGAKREFEKDGIVCEYYDLGELLADTEHKNKNEEASILIVRNVIDKFLKDKNTEDCLNEQLNLEWDKKATFRGQVRNKNARHNLCFDDVSQEPVYEEGKGTVISFKQVPCLEQIRKGLPKYIGDKAIDLKAEGNLYFDPKTTGIGFHGDGERRMVIGCRLGKSMNLVYNWFLKSLPIGKRIELLLNAGDIYIMSEKAVGTDWKKRNTLTLRHAAGADKYTKHK